MKHTLISWLCTVAVAIWATATGIAQEPFQVDPSFQTQLLSTSTVRDVVELPDGKLLISGMLQYPGDLNWLSVVDRLLPNGQRDPDFDLSPGGAGGFRLWNDKWYVRSGQGVRRLYNEGVWDQTFLTGFVNGTEPSNLYSIGQGGDYAVRSNGGLVLAGDHPLSDEARGFVGGYQLVWVDVNGELDTTMIHRQANGALVSIHPLQEGGFLLSGAGGMYDGQPAGGIIRTYSDGALDPSFQSPHLTWGYGRCFFPLPDGRILVGGAMQFGLGQDTLNLVRFMPDGSIDSTFNYALDPRQEHGTPYSTEGGISSIHDFGTDHLIITGFFTHMDGQVRGGIAMVDIEGNLVDDHFAGAGCGPAVPPLIGHPYVGVNGLAQLANGKLLLHGTFDGYTDSSTDHPGQRAITRLHGNPVGIAEHEAMSFTLYPNPANTLATVELEQLPRNGQLVLRDAMGREVLRQRVAGYLNKVELQGLGAGVYLLEVWEDGIRKAAQRLVVER